MKSKEAVAKPLPCPKCGGEAMVGSGKDYKFVNCTQCLLSNDLLCSSAMIKTSEDAIEDWNKRVQTEKRCDVKDDAPIPQPPPSCPPSIAKEVLGVSEPSLAQENTASWCGDVPALILAKDKEIALLKDENEQFKSIFERRLEMKDFDVDNMGKNPWMKIASEAKQEVASLTSRLSEAQKALEKYEKALRDIDAKFEQKHKDALKKWEGSGTEAFEDATFMDACCYAETSKIAATALESQSHNTKSDTK